MPYILSFIYQLYWLSMTMIDANSLDVLFCSWLLFACEQLQHLKHILKPLMELSATLDTVVPNSGELFKVISLYHVIFTFILYLKRNKNYCCQYRINKKQSSSTFLNFYTKKKINANKICDILKSFKCQNENRNNNIGKINFYV